ncbi:hypothetical protein JX265_000909 [Neoarthrinium moseri]|uniref:3-keto-steroid reductase n=1 Tax=Neoarthrinium moseri TaxID=1658444 RepID=A0A9P9WX71_9PEZI|nr:hypothetical protein JX266_007792 [Neoarthrinium moseri]KAI1880669.1 hypothetical protein JX265_000909 [Neoarthrinium moseri]
MASPWANVPSHEQCFVMVTGANSGVGLAICQRLMDDFLATRSLSSHLILIPTTRSAKKSCETIESLRAYLTKSAKSKKLANRSGDGYYPHWVTDRVHILSAELDLCKLPSIYSAAAKLLNGELRDPTGVIAGGNPLSIPWLDAVVCNAGYGGWSGLDWLGVASQVFSVGVMQSFTFPSFKVALPSSILRPQEVGGEKAQESQPEMGEVFTANTFGHYILVHQLIPLMSRASTPARVIWTSTVDAEEHHLDLDDLQGLRSRAAYESSKRLTDMISLSSSLPSVQKVSSSYFSSPSGGSKPRFYLTHPGVVCTPLFPLNAFLYFWYYLAMYVCRFLGSPWHTVETYVAACSAVWLALAPQDELEAENAERVKWGSACDRFGNDGPKKSEVEGWGWEGKIEDAEAIRQDPSEGIRRKLVGRKWDAVELTQEKRYKFEEDAVVCWRRLEELRTQWEDILGKGTYEGSEAKTAGKREA